MNNPLSIMVLKSLADSKDRLCGADLMKSMNVNSGKLYPVLMKLEGNGFIASRWEENPADELIRPRKRLYEIQPLGRDALSSHRMDMVYEIACRKFRSFEDDERTRLTTNRSIRLYTIYETILFIKGEGSSIGGCGIDFAEELLKPRKSMSEINESLRDAGLDEVVMAQDELLDRYAYMVNQEHAVVPIILHEECYKYYGRVCSIIDVNIFDTVRNAAVTVSTRDNEVSMTCISELQWNWGPTIGKRLREGEMIEQIMRG